MLPLTCSEVLLMLSKGDNWDAEIMERYGRELKVVPYACKLITGYYQRFFSQHST